MGYDMWMCNGGPPERVYYVCDFCNHEIGPEEAEESEVGAKGLEGSVCLRPTSAPDPDYESMLARCTTDRERQRLKRTHGGGSCGGNYHGRRIQSSCFRANISAMPVLRDAMTASGVMDWEWEAQWPAPSSLAPGDPDSPEYEAWAEAVFALHEPVRAARASNAGLVPAAKFCSNERWLVHPEECIIIARALDRLLELMAQEELIDEHAALSGALEIAMDIVGFETLKRIRGSMSLVREWSRFNRSAAGYGGYRVH